MIKLRDGELADILPTVFTRQPEVRAISYALKQSYSAYLSHQDTAYVYAFVDGAPEYVLDLLAVELRVKYYDTNYSVDVKRRLIKTAMLVNSKDGTKYAVATVVSNLFGSGRVYEWFDYGGVNGHFKIVLNVGDSYDVDRLINATETVKRKSQKLDGIELRTGAEGEIFVGHLMIESLTEKISCAVPEEFALVGGLIDELENILIDEYGRTLLDTEEGDRS